MRKLATAAAVALALASGGAFGLGLGDIEMRSALNQPMNAEIRLSSVKPGELDGMIVQLASPEAFARAGIERSQVLTDLRFSVDSSGQVPVIRITSARPVVEPFLNFLLEVDWPAGRMVREYTVLLDPPVFMTPSASARSTAGDTPARTGGDASLIAPAPIERGTNASVTDSFEVELVGDVSEVADDAFAAGAGNGGAGRAGEIVSLDGLDAGPEGGFPVPLGDVALIGDDGAGEIVPLTDLGAPNTEAAARRATANAAEVEFEVELVGDATEVADDVVVAGDGTRAFAGAGDGGEVVSLESIDPSAIGDAGTVGGSGVGDGEVRVAQGDTLFTIAAGQAPDEVSVQQMMLALLEANEAAFIDGNINLLRAGTVLRVPPPDEARRLTQALAVAEVGRQNGLWQDYRDNLRGAPTTRVARADTADAEADAGTRDGGADTAAADPGARDNALSDNARAILEEARAEILNRDELRIVAAEDTAEGAAVVGNAADGDPAARAGAIDRRLQLAREELASTRLEAEDLGEQASELGGTAENLDALVSLRQNEVAALERRLAEARRGASGAADDLADAAAGAGGEGADALAAAGNAARDGLGVAAEAAGDGLDATGDAIGGAAGNVADAADGAVADARNALSDAGQTLGEVTLVGEGEGESSGAEGASADGGDAPGAGAGDVVGTTDDAATAVAVAAEADRPWYQSLLADPARLAIAGVGGAALLGVLGTLLWRRRRRDETGYDEDDVRFLDEADAAAFRDGGGRSDAADVDTARNVRAGPAGIGAAGAAAAGMAGAATRGDALDAAAFREAMGDGDEATLDETQVFTGGEALSGKHAGADLGRDADDGLDKDDTISEADVYLAYGLHGQAEELLGRAVEREPGNATYARKLLDTYHAQGNGEAFHRAATDYHERFGGAGSPDWAGVAVQGADLRPGDALYAGGIDGATTPVDGVAASGAASGGDAFDDNGLDDNGFGDNGFGRDDFAAPAVGAAALAGAGAFAVGAAGRDADDAAAEADGFDEGDETALMDQSLDPAFAFDEGDLEATGDFSTITDEVADETEEGVIEFTGFDDDVPAMPRERAAAADAMDSLDAPELSGFGELDLVSGATAANEKHSGDIAPGVPAKGVANDLTLDLDELSGELELDGTELLDGAVDDFQMADLTADDESLLNVTGGADDGFGDMTTGFDADGDADEMDTMMDLAKAYIDMGDKDSASSALDEIVRSGTPDQVVEAETLLKKIS